MIVLMASVHVQAQVADKKGMITAEIKTSAECGMCKDKIEEALYFTKGVKKADLDPISQVLTVKFKENKTDLDAIRKVVAEAGYDADDVAANAEEYEKLPTCCKKGAHAADREQH